jgi:hypothetical protein
MSSDDVCAAISLLEAPGLITCLDLAVRKACEASTPYQGVVIPGSRGARYQIYRQEDRTGYDLWLSVRWDVKDKDKLKEKARKAGVNVYSYDHAT